MYGSGSIGTLGAVNAPDPQQDGECNSEKREDDHRLEGEGFSGYEANGAEDGGTQEIGDEKEAQMLLDSVREHEEKVADDRREED
jgi:hypothetical protein